MKGLRVWLAEHWRTSVPLNLGELERLVDALADVAESRRRDPEARPLLRKIGRARDRRLRAVERARA